ncbi:unnamed protein product, partial [Rotaria sordida]
MVKTQREALRSRMAPVDRMTTLTTATGDTHASLTSSSSNQTSLSSTVGSSTSKIVPSSLPKETNFNSNTIAKKKTKPISKTQIINCGSGPKNNDDESDDEAHYDLQTCIEETGGLDRFLNTPCMILYKNNLKNQSSARKDCEEFVGKNRDRSINLGILASIKHSQNETYRNRNNEEEKTSSLIGDIMNNENANSGSSGELEENEKESEPSVNEDESSEEETSQIN